MAYDGEGNRGALKVTAGTTPTTTYYLGAFEEITGSAVTKYYNTSGLPGVMRASRGNLLSTGV